MPLSLSQHDPGLTAPSLLQAPMRLTREFGPGMAEKGGGLIVTVGSLGGEAGWARGAKPAHVDVICRLERVMQSRPCA